MSNEIINGSYLKKYRKEMVSILKRMYPDIDKDTIKKLVTKEMEKTLQNPEVVLENNYTGERRDTNLISVLDWAIDEEPIIAGNMTFYKKQDDAINPVAQMLKDKLKDRKNTKKRMFAVEETDPDMYEDLDRLQGTIKRLVNSYYGASGAPTSAFYSLFSGPATTASSQEAISTAENMFEGFVADNYNFIDINELMEWCEATLFQLDFLDGWVRAAKREEVEERLIDKVMNITEDDIHVIKAYLSTLNIEELTYIFYKNNMIEFIYRNKKISSLILDIFKEVSNLEYIDEKDEHWLDKVPYEYQADFCDKKVKDWNKFVNKMYFMDPNDAPNTIEAILQELNKYMMKYVYSDWLAFDRIYRLRNMKRRSVIIIDTDSNILALDTMIHFIFDKVLRGKNFGRDLEHNEFIAVNTLAYLLTSAVSDILYKFSTEANICEDYRGLINMKNEFYFRRVIVGLARKRYISKITLREGNLLHPPKVDIKG